MDEELILETTFLIDFERERHRGAGAAVCLAHGMALVTANERHFRRVPGLRVLPYR